MTVGACMAVAVGALASGTVAGRRQPRLWLGTVLIAAVALLVGGLAVLLGGVDWEWRGGFRVGGESLHVRLDAVSALFLVLLAIVGGTGAVYASEYWNDGDKPASAGRGRVGWSALVLSMAGVLLASNGLHFLLSWELFTVSAYFLVTLDRRSRAVRRAGWLYLAASHAGTVLLFAFFASLAHRTGSWELGSLRDVDGAAAHELAPLFWLALIGFGVKAGLFPLHVWLPSAHANAPSHVSAILSGVAIKMGVYGIVRFSGWLPLPVSAGWVVIGLGAVGAILGIAFALVQDDLKLLLAYCSVENVGVILIGLGGAMLATAGPEESWAWGRLALAGAFLHVWNHGLFKALLFFAAGSLLHATGTREMSRLGGLWRIMPWTATCFAVGSMAVSALPPLNGFVSEWLIYLGLFDAVIAREPASWAIMPAVIVLGVAGALALAAFIKAGTIVFMGAARTRHVEHAHECGPAMRGAMGVLAALCLTLGLGSGLLAPVLTRVTLTWYPAGGDAVIAAPLERLGGVGIALGVLLVAAFAFVILRVRRTGVVRAGTWDCGYATPTSRMQYTSASFAGLAGAWFSWVLRPQRRLRRPRGPMPGRSLLVERHPETVLDLMIRPAAGVVLRVSTAVRRLQHGRLQSYIMYLMAGIAALTLIVLLGGCQ